ncbi:uncharacterized protein METZ01_LOCUS153134 [marine metagenome]|uniref:Uncharacterized protein n=1 Tax=marine metagenome TaxID=408172 RepID=A0A382AFE0_9ZZZZ
MIAAGKSSLKKTDGSNWKTIFPMGGRRAEVFDIHQVAEGPLAY